MLCLLKLIFKMLQLPDDFGEDSQNPEEKKNEQTGDG